MSTTDHDAALAVVKATSEPIHDIGTAIYLSPDVFGWAAEWGSHQRRGFASGTGERDVFRDDFGAQSGV